MSDLHGRVLVIDDDPDFRVLAVSVLKLAGNTVVGVGSARAGLDAIAESPPEVVCLDLGLPDRDGIDLLDELASKHRSIPVVVLTADESVESIVSSMQRGAFDYLRKPVDHTKLMTTVRIAIERHRLESRVIELESRPHRMLPDLVGTSAAMETMKRQIQRVADSDVSVLLWGESGSGKEMAARGIHELSARRDGPFVAINCAAIAESLQESELFGHERGAFTGAQARRVGRFEQADGGTLFLDEVAELSAASQAKLLRVLQERVFRRVGGNDEIRSDFRLLAATHKDLQSLVTAGEFREDLFYRVAVFEFEVPPLRQRTDDIPLLVRKFLDALSDSDDDKRRLSTDALESLTRYAWPGNVRELQNAVQRAAVVADDEVIRKKDLPQRILRQVDANPVHDSAPTRRAPATTPSTSSTTTQLPTCTLAELEKMAITQALERHDGNIVACTRALGIGRTTLYRKLKSYGLR